MSISTVFHIVN